MGIILLWYLIPGTRAQKYPITQFSSNSRLYACSQIYYKRWALSEPRPSVRNDSAPTWRTLNTFLNKMWTDFHLIQILFKKLSGPRYPTVPQSRRTRGNNSAAKLTISVHYSTLSAVCTRTCQRASATKDTVTVSQELRSLLRYLIPELILNQKFHIHMGPIRNGSGVMSF